MDPNLIKGIESQTKKLTDSELTELKLKIKNLPCPDCGKQSTPLVGSLIRTVKSKQVNKKKSALFCEFCGKQIRENPYNPQNPCCYSGLPSVLLRGASKYLAMTELRKIL